jgi:hypothetical protein
MTMRAITRLAVASSAVATGLTLRRRMLRWGATDSELRADLPGYALIGSADLTSTRAITIRASAAEVWPWLAQLGQGRGGFYSYDVLENLLGMNIHSADSIVEEWQQIGVGSTVRLAAEVPLTVAAVERGRYLVLSGGIPIGALAPPFDTTWAFVLRYAHDGSPLLVVRER